MVNGSNGGGKTTNPTLDSIPSEVTRESLMEKWSNCWDKCLCLSNKTIQLIGLIVILLGAVGATARVVVANKNLGSLETQNLNTTFAPTANIVARTLAPSLVPTPMPSTSPKVQPSPGNMDIPT